MKNFFETAKNSIWNREFYAVMDSRTTRESIRYFLSLLFLVSFIMTAVISIYAVPESLSFFRKSADFLAAKYPADIKITLDGGLASTTPAGIYALKITPDFFGTSEIAILSARGVNNILVIDAGANFENRRQFEAAKTMALLARDSFVTIKKQGGFEVNQIPKDLNLIITKPLVDKWSGKILSAFKFILPFLTALGFLFLFITNAVGYLILSVIGALILWAIGGLTGRKGHYRQFFNAALYAGTLPIVFDLAVFVVAGSGLSPISVIVLIVAIWAINVRIWEKADLPSAGASEPPMIK